MPYRNVLTWGLVPLTVLAIGYTALAPGDHASGAAPAISGFMPAAKGFQWFWTLKGPHSADAGIDMAVDADGNVFVAGFHGGLDLDGDDIVDLVADRSDVLFMKVSPRADDRGVNVAWVRAPRSPGLQRSSAIAPDQHGGAYALGRFRDTLVFESGLLLLGGGAEDGFLARYGDSGDLLWARAFGGPGPDVLMDVSSDLAGNAYVIGWGSGWFPLDDAGTEFRSAAGQPAAIIASYDPDGAVRWALTLNAPVRPTSIEVTLNGEVFVTGEAEGPVDFDGDGTADLLMPYDRDGFVARFDQDGSYLGAWLVGAVPVKIAFAADGDLLLLGMLGGPMTGRYGVADFDGDGATDATIRGGGATSVWVARYTPAGDLRWVRSYAMGRVGGLAAEGGRVVITGSYLGIEDLDEDGVPERVDHTVDPDLESEIAILVISEDDGAPQRAWTAPGPGRDHAGAAVFLPGRPVLYVTGYVQLTADFTGDGKDGEGWAKCEALGDLFFARYQALSSDSIG